MKSTASALFLILAFLCGCSSTGNPSHPISFIGWHQLAFGHDKYTPVQKIEARCRYFNQFPNGEHTGFSRACRLKAASEFGMGINSAMYATMCVIDKCYVMASTWDKENPR